VGSRFGALSDLEKEAVAAHVRAQHAALICLKPETYAVRKATVDPERWRERLCELIASDPKRVRAILEAARREGKETGGGFTLIELSIVLVIIGLIVGGVLAGRDLIKAAEVRAQISQIEKFNTAVNTFYGKYEALPGDLNAQVATGFGFTPRGQNPGQGDGNGVLQGWSGEIACGNCQTLGETALFWVDLTTANGQNVNLIEGAFSTAVAGGFPSLVTGSQLDAYFPAGKIGGGNYLYAYSNNTGINYFGLSTISYTGATNGTLYSAAGLTVQQAYSIDKKIDDGFPQSGNVTAQYLNQNIWGGGTVWAAGAGGAGTADSSATPGSATTCYDNGNVWGTQLYSVEISGGANVNCALSFQFQ
jgi:prepilin-type N-terminal cleavage/methylation domain-containing protein